MFPRIVNIMYVRKHCFYLTMLGLCIAITSLTMYLLSFHYYYNSAHAKLLYKKRNNAVNELLRFGSSNLDGSGQYIVYRDVNVGVKATEHSLLTVATHCTLSNIASLLLLLENWTGTVSLALFIDSSDDVSVVFKAFAYCNYNFVHRLQLHIVRPTKQIGSDTSLLSKNIKLPNFFKDPLLFCHKFSSLLSDCKEKKRNYDSSFPYPNNLLRNVACDSVKSDFLLHLDIDMLPSKNLNKLFRDFIDKLPPRYFFSTAFVLPSFEMNSIFFNLNRKQFPIDKTQLSLLYTKRLIRPFYSEICYHCQNRTDYLKWFSFKSSEKLTIVYNVDWSHAYEPFFISSRKHTPPFDESFKQYGYNRLSLLCEMHMAGWQFSVLDPAFLLHVGFKQDSAIFYDKKQDDMSRNWKLYNSFRNRLKSKYTNNSKNCDIPPIYIG